MSGSDPMSRHLRMVSDIAAALALLIDEFVQAEKPKAHDPDLTAWVVLLIEEVLADHHPVTSTHSRNRDQSLRIICHHDSPLPPGNFRDAKEWRDHVITIITRKLKTIQALMNSQTDRTP